MSDLFRSAVPLLTQAATTLRQHPRRVSAAVLVLLGGFAVTAFGVAPMAADETAGPAQRVLSEPLPIDGLQAQLEALAASPMDLHRGTVTRSSDTADVLLKRLGAVDPAAAQFLRSDPLARLLVDGKPGKMVEARTQSDGELQALIARFPALEPEQAQTHFSRLRLERVEGRWVSTLQTLPFERQTRIGSATVRGTLWTAVDEARLPESIASQMIDIFSADIDFHRQIRRGDAFRVVFEQLQADGQPITWGDATGRILAAEYTNRGKRFTAVWFADPESGRGDYFTLDGRNRRPAFLPSPVPFSRVTSGFAMRIHPLLQVPRQHKGIDYAAPTGTDVLAVSEGTVTFAGRQSGYGNVIQVQHAKGRETLYAHLSAIRVQVGDKVGQGQVIGAVGSTGWATGPHLHFEFHENGVVRDPEEVAALSETLTIDREDRPLFRKVSGQMKQHLALADSLSRFRGDAE